MKPDNTNPFNSSVIKEPVYHGTSSRFDKFKTGVDTERAVLFAQFKVKSQGIFFSQSAKDAKSYGKNVVKCWVNLTNPLFNPNTEKAGEPGRETYQRFSKEKEQDFVKIFSPLAHEVDIDGEKVPVIEKMIGRIEVRDVRFSSRSEETYPEWIYELLGDGGIIWDVMDDEGVAQRMKALGYDGTFVNEPNDYSGSSIFVLSPNQVEIIDWGDYGSEEMEESTILESQEFKYGLPLRPAGVGSVPAGYSKYDEMGSYDDSGERDRSTRHGVVIYPNELSDEEIKRFELVPIHNEAYLQRWIDKAWAKLGKYAHKYLEMGGEEALSEQMRSMAERFGPIHPKEYERAEKEIIAKAKGEKIEEGAIGEAKESFSDLDLALEKYKRNFENGKYAGMRSLTPSEEEEIRNIFSKIKFIFRAIRVKSKEDIDLNNAGIYWTFDPNAPSAYWGDPSDRLFILVAKAKDNEIDWLYTVEQYLKPQYAESEVRLKKGSHPEVVEVFDDMEPFWDKYARGKGDQKSVTESLQIMDKRNISKHIKIPSEHDPESDGSGFSYRLSGSDNIYYAFESQVESMEDASPFEIKNFSGTLYHGSASPISKFTLNGDGQFGKGLYLTPDKEVAKFYSTGGKMGAPKRGAKEGHVYEFEVNGKCLFINDLYEFTREMISDVEDAEEAFSQWGEVLHGKVTRYISEYVRDNFGVDMIWFPKGKSVMGNVEQVLVLNLDSFRPKKTINESFIQDFIDQYYEKDWGEEPEDFGFIEENNELNDLTFSDKTTDKKYEEDLCTATSTNSLTSQPRCREERCSNQSSETKSESLNSSDKTILSESLQGYKIELLNPWTTENLVKKICNEQKVPARDERLLLDFLANPSVEGVTQLRKDPFKYRFKPKNSKFRMPFIALLDRQTKTILMDDENLFVFNRDDMNYEQVNDKLDDMKSKFLSDFVEQFYDENWGEEPEDFGFNIEEMAAPDQQMKETVWYHGTPKEKYAEAIWRDGIKPDLKQVKGVAAPIAGRTYASSNLPYAIIYAIGGDFAGVKLPESFYEDDRYGYLFKISGDQFSDVQPDEDQVGEAIGNDVLPFLSKFHNVLSKKSYRPKQFSNLLNAVKDGDYTAWIKAGKIVLPLLSDQEKLEIVKKMGNVANLGVMKPFEMWKIDKARTQELKKDGSNFFEIAEKIH